MNKLLAAISDSAALMLVSNVDSLPSVGPGAVLADIIASGAVPTVCLTERGILVKFTCSLERRLLQ